MKFKTEGEWVRTHTLSRTTCGSDSQNPAPSFLIADQNTDDSEPVGCLAVTKLALVSLLLLGACKAFEVKAHIQNQLSITYIKKRQVRTH